MIFQLRLAGLALLLASSVVAQDASLSSASKSKCRCGPDDKCWPSSKDWEKLNSDVDGNLIKTVPIGSVCRNTYDGKPTFDSAKCEALKAGWTFPDVHLVSSSSVMQQLWANASCDPFDAPDAPCTLGEYVRYSVEVKEQSHVQTALKFVQKNNIRLVIRNTGHDDLGKSTGYGSLGIWLHKIKGLKYLPEFKNDLYKGPAIKIMAGDSSRDVLAELAKQGKVAISGACPTVGAAGGHFQGGGHSPLGSQYGLSADNVVEMEVITADGKFLTLSSTSNSQLFWALRGGGPGTYAVVWSITTKVFPDLKVTTANLAFTIGNHTEDEFFEAVEVYNSLIPSIGDAGGYTFGSVYIYLGFNLSPLFGPGLSVDQVKKLLKPLVDKLDQLGFDYTYTTKTYPTYLEAYDKAFAPWGVGGQFGSRLIPRKVIQTNPKGLIATYKEVYHALGYLNFISLSPNKKVSGNPDNAVLPAWRDADIHLIIGQLFVNGAENFQTNIETQHRITDQYTGPFKKLIPDGGCYMNEADGFDPDWQQDFYGANYPRLLEIKKKYDPDTIFWCNRAVGSEQYAENNKGVLCKV